MKLMCPLCGEETEVREAEGFACDHCGGWVHTVPNGRAFLLRPAAKAVPGEERVRPLLERAAAMADPVRRKALLTEAEELCPDSLAVQTELLHLGRLDQRSPRRLDYHVIKCYLLHIFECPEDESPEARAAMLEELTHDPRLVRCLSLAGDQEAFLKDYLTRLCREYINLFLKGSSIHMRRFMGMQLQKTEKSLAYPAAVMLRTMELTDLPDPFDRLLPACFLEAFRQEVGSDAYLQAARKELEA